MALIIERFKKEESWLESRHKGISATDVGALLGLASFGKTKLDVYMKIQSHTESKLNPDSPALRRGRLLEPLIRQSFAIDNEDEYVIHEPPKRYANWIWYDSERPYLRGSLDGWLTRKKDKEKGVLEIKTVDLIRKKETEEWESNTLPYQYYLQVLTYLAITKWSYGILVARLRYYKFNDNDEKYLDKVVTKSFYIEAKEVKKDIDIVLRVVDNFWKNNIEAKKIPEVRIA